MTKQEKLEKKLAKKAEKMMKKSVKINKDVKVSKPVKNSEQKEWLKNSDFLVNLVKLDFQFVNYIVSGKIPMNQVEAEQKSIAKVNKK